MNREMDGNAIPELCFYNNTANQKLLVDIAIDVVVPVFGVARESILTIDKHINPPVALSRQVVMYIANTVGNLGFSSIGRVLSRDRTTVAHGCQNIEDKRDNDSFDVLLDEIGDHYIDLLKKHVAAKPETSQHFV